MFVVFHYKLQQHLPVLCITVRTVPLERRSARNTGKTIDYIELDDNAAASSTPATKPTTTALPEPAAPADLPARGDIVKLLPTIGM